jgi:hypothetical protein
MVGVNIGASLVLVMIVFRTYDALLLACYNLAELVIIWLLLDYHIFIISHMFAFLHSSVPFMDLLLVQGFKLRIYILDGD